MSMEYESRRQTLRRAMAEAGIDCVCITSGNGLRYLSGVVPTDSEDLLMLVLSASHSTLLLPHAKKDTAEHNLSVIPYRSSSEIEQALSPLLTGTVAVETASFPPALEQRLRRGPHCKIEALQDASPLLSAMRRCKDETELAALSEACRLTDGILHQWRQALRPGVTEQELFQILEEISRAAAVSESCPGILIAAGPNSSLPHGGNTTRALQEGDPIFIDCGARYQGYYCDITRTFFLGEPDEEMQKVYQTVLEAQAAAIAAAGPGVPVREVDQAARRVIEHAGYGSFFPHRTGHGLGLSVHESPSVASDEDQVLSCGMVITVEPGIYLPGRWGVRIEDDVVVEPQGVRVLNAFPKALSDMIVPL